MNRKIKSVKSYSSSSFGRCVRDYSSTRSSLAEIKILFLTSLIIIFLFFSAMTYAGNPQVTNYKLNGKEENARINPSRGDVVSIEINTNVPVKFSRIAICKVADSNCNDTFSVRYFTKTTDPHISSVTRDWNGKTNEGVIVPDGDYQITVKMKDEISAEYKYIQRLSPYVITIDSNFTGGSGGSSSSISQSYSNQTQSNSSSSSTATSGTSYFTSVYSSSSAGSSPIATYLNTFEVSAGSDRLVYTDTTVDFVAEVGVSKGFSEQAVKYVWSFGDGGTGDGKKVSHIYKFAGDYIVVLNGSLSDTSAVSRTNVKVINSSVFISNITGDSVEITNQGTYEINLKGWSISNSIGKFFFSSDTIVASNKKIAVPNEYMKLNLAQGGKVSLLNPSGKEAGLFPTVSAETVAITDYTNTSSKNNLDNDPVVKKAREFIARGGKSSTNNSASIPKNNLIGQVRETSSVKNKNVSVFDKDKIISSSTLTAMTVSSQTQRHGFMRRLLNLPFAGFSLIKRVFYSGN